MTRYRYAKAIRRDTAEAWRDAVFDALAASGGNVSAAAHAVGCSRFWVYLVVQALDAWDAIDGPRDAARRAEPWRAAARAALARPPGGAA